MEGRKYTGFAATWVKVQKCADALGCSGQTIRDAIKKREAYEGVPADALLGFRRRGEDWLVRPGEVYDFLSLWSKKLDLKVPDGYCAPGVPAPAGDEDKVELTAENMTEELFELATRRSGELKFSDLVALHKAGLDSKTLEQKLAAAVKPDEAKKMIREVLELWSETFEEQCTAIADDLVKLAETQTATKLRELNEGLVGILAARLCELVNDKVRPAAERKRDEQIAGVEEMFG